MDMQQIKIYLRDNPTLIENILEKIDCHHIKTIGDKRVQSALPYPSDNQTSVQVILNDSLTAKVYTKNDFQNYEIKDIFTLVQYIKTCSLIEARNLICDVCNIKFTNNNKKLISESYSFLKKYKRSVTKEEYIEDEIILDESFLTRFVRADCVLFLEDGVNSLTQQKFGVSYDVLDNRIVFPIRNDEGNLLSFKGRTCDKDYKINGIPKFISYYPCNNNNYLFGLYENYYDILLANEIIVVEAEKGVMQLDSMKINNVVAINKKTITSIQLKKLLKLGKNIVLALDNDVTLEEIFIECKKFNGLCDVFYIKDKLNLLNDKDSPCDQGIEIFQRLYTECKFQYKGE
jgi:DNA primase